MDVKLLKTFLLVAKLLNITQAAEQLKFSQPAITAQIYSLEDELKVRLFDRNGKRLKLTEAGEKMIEYAENIISLCEEAKNVMATFSHRDDTIKLAVSTQMINYFLPSILMEFQTQMPHINVSVEICMNKQEVLKGLMEHRYDLGFIHGENTFSQIRQHGIWTEDMVWVAGREYLKAHPCKKGEWGQYPIINYTNTTVFRGKLEEIAGPGAFQSLVEYSDSEAIKRAVMAGLGISYLPRTLVKDEISRKILVPLEGGPKIQFRISLVHHKDKLFSVPMYALLLVLANQPSADESIKELL